MTRDSAARTKSTRDPRGQLVLDVRSLGRAPGSSREVIRTVTLAERIGLDLIGVPAGGRVQIAVQLQAVSEGVLVTGSVSAPLRGECSRCLETFDDHIAVRLTELFAYPDSLTEQTTEDDEVYRMDTEDRISLEPVLVDALGLALPLQPLCRPDCPGLCAECGVSMAVAGPDHRHEILDPRWAGLAKFTTTSGAPDNPEHRPEEN